MLWIDLGDSIAILVRSAVIALIDSLMFCASRLFEQVFVWLTTALVKFLLAPLRVLAKVVHLMMIKFYDC